jgi:hypothetical protein
MRKSFFRNFALAGFVLVSGVSAVVAQEKNPTPSQNPSDESREM